MIKWIILLSLNFLATIAFSQYDWDGVDIGPSPGPGMIWDLQTNVSDDFNYTAMASSSPTTIGGKWTNFYHNAWTGPLPTIWKRDHVMVNNGKFKIINSRPGLEEILFEDTDGTSASPGPGTIVNSTVDPIDSTNYVGSVDLSGVTGSPGYSNLSTYPGLAVTADDAGDTVTLSVDLYIPPTTTFAADDFLFLSIEDSSGDIYPGTIIGQSGYLDGIPSGGYVTLTATAVVPTGATLINYILIFQFSNMGNMGTAFFYDNFNISISNGTPQTVIVEGQTLEVTNSGCATSIDQVIYPVYIETNVKVMNSVLASDVWLLSSDDTQEIDICEAYGSDRWNNPYFTEKRLHLSHHVFITSPFTDWQPSDPGSFYTDSTTIWRDNFHTIGVYWKDSVNLEYYVDGQLVRTRSGMNQIDPLFHTNAINPGDTLNDTRTGLSKSMDIILNTEDQTWRALDGLSPTAAEFSIPTDHIFEIDWIRVYKPIIDTVQICYSNLTNGAIGIGLQNSETGVADYESSNWIETANGVSTIIQSGASVDYDALDHIILNNGFEVKMGAAFNAFIDGCNNGAGGINLIDVNQESALKAKSELIKNEK